MGFLDERPNSVVQKRLSFTFDFVTSGFLSPAWRNWQTRWTQNPVAARPCGFEPLRRQSILYCMLNVQRLTFQRATEFLCPNVNLPKPYGTVPPSERGTHK